MRPAWIAATCALAAVGVVVGPGPVGHARAGSLAEAIARHRGEDVDRLRARLPGDASVRCALGTVYARRGDLPRAMLFLTGCEDAALPDDIARDVVRATRDVKKALRASELAELEIVADPAGLAIELDALRGEQLTAPITVWVAAGTHTVRASLDGRQVHGTITLRPYSRGLLPLDTRPPTAAPARTGQLDFADENAGESQAGPPPDVKRSSMMSARHRGVAGPRLGPELDDPLARRPARGPRPWFGLRLGGGRFDDATAAATLRPSIAAAARFALTPRGFVAARLDGSRRGGAGTTAIDTAGLALGAGATVVAHRVAALAVIGQLRGDLRFAETRDMLPVRRAGVAAAAALEIAFPSTPLTAAVRLEHGLTELVAGARDRAVLIELGVDWR